jgi:hypothetical protein
VLGPTPAVVFRETVVDVVPAMLGANCNVVEQISPAAKERPAVQVPTGARKPVELLKENGEAAIVTELNALTMYAVQAVIVPTVV